MTESLTPNAATNTLPPVSVNGSAPPQPAQPEPTPAQPTPAQPTAAAPGRRKMNSRISGVRTALIVGFVLLVLVLIFVIQNAHAVNISFLGAHLQLSLAVALLLAAVAGAVVMAAAGTARITQLRQIMRRDRRKFNAR